MNALAELEKWSRKYYSFEITSGSHIQPGDGVQVVLKAGGRTVIVDEEELSRCEEDIYPSIGDIILEAIRRWHAHDGIKNYHLYWTHEGSFEPDEDVQWCWWTKTMIQAKLQARNEAEALQKIRNYGVIGNITVYER